MSNSVVKTDRDVRKFLRENGIKPSVENVQRIGKEIRRTQGENESVDKIHKELEREGKASPLYDNRGDARARTKRDVERELRRRSRG